MGKRNLLKAVKAAAGTAFVLGTLLWAGTSDYRDDVVCRMKNSGAYERLAETHPGADEAELVKIYEEQLRREEGQGL